MKPTEFDNEEDLTDYSDEVVTVPIEDYIDLHTFAPKDIKSIVEAYLSECYERQFPLVRIIHGKGIGVQREIVRKTLSQSPYVVSFADAPPDAGSWGATIAYLKIVPNA